MLFLWAMRQNLVILEILRIVLSAKLIDLESCELTIVAN